MIRVFVGKAPQQVGAEELKWESATTEDLVSLASTPALFGDARIFVLRDALAGEKGDELLELIEMFIGSPHTFVFEEEKLLKAPTEKLAEAGVKVETEKVEKKEWKFDQFGVASALGAKDKKKLWLGLTLALRAGEKPEALAGLLAWKARQMGDANLSRKITFMYHDSHRGAGDLELLLERFALKL